MAHQQDILVDPFLKQSSDNESIPSNDAVLICSYDLSFSIDSTEEATYLLRGNNQDELWIETEYETGCAYIVLLEGTPHSASLRLLDRLFRDRVGFYWPTEFISSGIIKKRSFNSLLKKIERELEKNRKKARKSNIYKCILLSGLIA